MGLKSIFFISIGILALILGLVGTALPILPTTPFVLIAAACFGSSSPKLYQKLANTKYFGAFITNYKNHTGIPKKVKYQSIGFLWVTLGISALLFGTPLVWAILLTVGLAVTAHILLL